MSVAALSAQVQTHTTLFFVHQFSGRKSLALSLSLLHCGSESISQCVKKDIGFTDAALKSTSNHQVIYQGICPVFRPVIHQVIKGEGTHQLPVNRKSSITKVRLLSRNANRVLNRTEDVAPLSRFLFTYGWSKTSLFALLLLYPQLDWGIMYLFA